MAVLASSLVVLYVHRNHKAYWFHHLYSFTIYIQGEEGSKGYRSGGRGRFYVSFTTLSPPE